MLYNLTAIGYADRRLIAKAIVGGEKILYVSQDVAFRVGDIRLDADATPTYTANAVNTEMLSGVPSDLQIVVTEGLLSSAAALVTVVGTAADDSLLSGLATFSPPAWARNQSFNFPRGVAFDLVPNVSTKQFKTISSVTVTNAKKGTAFRLVALPVNWTEVGGVENVRIMGPHRKGVSIPDGLNATDQVTFGRGEEQKLTIDVFDRGINDSLRRMSDGLCSLRMDVRSNGRILKERHVFANVALESNPDFGAGGDIVKSGTDGAFEDFLGFAAL